MVALKPLVEDQIRPSPDGKHDRTETPCSGAANHASALMVAENGLDPASHMIFASAAGPGDFRIDQLDHNSAWYSETLLLHIEAARAFAASYVLHAFAWLQGENDSCERQRTSRAEYRAKLDRLRRDIEADARRIGGQASPVNCITYQTVAHVAQWKDVSLAQLDLAQSDPLFSLATPIYHLPHAADRVHLTSAGYKRFGAYVGRAYKCLILDGVAFPWLNPISAHQRGRAVSVSFNVPYPPLVLDVEGLSPTRNFGFRVMDGNVEVPIASIVVNRTEVCIVLAREPLGAVAVRYGLDFLGEGLTIVGGASGNLRDSDPSCIEISGALSPLYNVCPHFELFTRGTE